MQIQPRARVDTSSVPKHFHGSFNLTLWHLPCPQLPFLDDDKVMFTPYFPEREKIVDENGVCVKRKREHIPSFLQNEEFIELAQDELVLIPKMLGAPSPQ
jgi:hypothetical protein